MDENLEDEPLPRTFWLCVCVCVTHMCPLTCMFLPLRKERLPLVGGHDGDGSTAGLSSVLLLPSPPEGTSQSTLSWLSRTAHH